MDNQNQGGDRQMFQGDWTCSDCGVAIKELPFEPDGSRPIFCQDCHRKQRDNRMGDRPEKQMFKGDWTCSGCGVEIKELPFEPKGDSPIFCRDCYMKNKQ